MFVILLELFLVLYPSISSLVSLTSPAAFSHSILPCVLWVCKSFGQGCVTSLPIWDFFSFKLFARQLILLYLWNNTRLSTKSDIILYASDLQNMCRSTGNRHHLKQPLLTEIKDCLMFALCYSWKVLCIKITSYTKYNYDKILKIWFLLFFFFFTFEQSSCSTSVFLTDSYCQITCKTKRVH